jgi:hypothetical protein
MTVWAGMTRPLSSIWKLIRLMALTHRPLPASNWHIGALVSTATDGKDWNGRNSEQEVVKRTITVLRCCPLNSAIKMQLFGGWKKLTKSGSPQCQTSKWRLACVPYTGTHDLPIWSAVSAYRHEPVDEPATST